MLSLRSSRLRETTTIGNRHSRWIDRAPVADQARTGRHMLPSSTNFILATMAFKRFTFMFPERGRSSGLAWRECSSVGASPWHAAKLRLTGILFPIGFVALVRAGSGD